MQRILSQACLLVSFLSFPIVNLSASSFEDEKKNQMIQDIEVIKHHFNVGYAPAAWKKEYMNWDLDQAFENAKNQILSTPSITTKQFQQIVCNFINSMNDYHVDVLFFSTESAFLPFGVKGVNGRYFIDWIDSLRLPISHYDINVGDEILEFDGKTINQAIEELKTLGGKSSNPNTDQALAEVKLTHRAGMSGDIVPKGPVVIAIKSKETGKRSVYQLHWSYTPEHVKNPLDFIPLTELTATATPYVKWTLPQIKMVSPLHEVYTADYNREGSLGARKSFVPLLGEPIWMKEEETSSSQKETCDSKLINWYAYIYRHPQMKKTIGYIRIPHYMGRIEDAKEFGEILDYMQEYTDALVIDQVHNFGGLVDFQYELASMLVIKEPLSTPYHRVKLTQKEVLEAYTILEFINVIDLILQSKTSDSESEEVDNAMGINYQRLMFVKAYYETLLEDWNLGRTLTRPTPILGVDKINPHPRYHYTKPILMLIDEMDFSGGDFVPAILQDNRRAILFGNRTAGAGGFVYTFEFPNSHGIALCSYTASIAERINLKKIENLGVTPDIKYQLTIEDLQEGYQSYANAVNQAVLSLFHSKK